MFTKHVDGTLSQKMMIKIGLEHRGGRAESAPQLVRGTVNKKSDDVHMESMDSLEIDGEFETEMDNAFIDMYEILESHIDGSMPSGDMFRHAVGVRANCLVGATSHSHHV